MDLRFLARVRQHQRGLPQLKAEVVRVELRLSDGPAYRFDLPLDSAAHRELIALGSSMPSTDPPRLLQIPLDGGRAALSFTSRHLVRLTLTPDGLPESTMPRPDPAGTAGGLASAVGANLGIVTSADGAAAEDSFVNHEQRERHDAGTPRPGDRHARGNAVAVLPPGRRDDGISKPAEEGTVDHDIVTGHPGESFTTDGVQFPNEIPANEYERVLRKAEPQLERFHSRQPQRHDELSRLCADVPEGPLIVTTFNHGFADLFRNWVASCDVHRIAVRDRTIVFATDSGAHELARAHGFRSFVDTESYGDVTRESVAAYGDRQYRELMFVKSAVVEDALRLGRDVLFQDIDLVWLKDPLPPLRDGAQRSGFDYQFMFDGPNPRFRHTHFNSGFFYIRNSAPARDVWSLVTNRYDRVLWCGSQQFVVNIVMQHSRKRGLRVLRLPEYAFLNGHLLHRAHDRRWSPALAAAANVVHASWTKDLEAKRCKLRENGLWYLLD